MFAVFVYEKLEKGEKEHLVLRTKSWDEAIEKARSAVQHPKCSHAEVFKSYVSFHKERDKIVLKPWERPKVPAFMISGE